MQKRVSVMLVLVAWLLSASSAQAWLYIIPTEKLFDPIANLAGSWNLSFDSSDSQDDDPETGLKPVRGYYINSSGHFFFRGNTTVLNDFAARCENAIEYQRKENWYQEIIPVVILHTGKCQEHIPASSEVVPANWKLELLKNTDLVEAPHKVHRKLTINIHVWLDSELSLSDLRFPKSFAVTSGGEIESFIDRRETSRRE